MGKNIKYGEFTFSKPKPRPTVKGYAFGGATEPVAEPMAAPMAAKQPIGMSPPPPVSRPVQKPVVTPKPTPAPMSPAAKLAAENKAVIDKANLNPNRAGKPLLIEKDAMKAALDRNLAIRQATEARHRAEAKANAIPSTSPYRQDQMKQAKARAKPFEKGGKAGLWDNIHAKRERIKEGSGEKMRKAGSKGAPSAQDFKNSAKKMQYGGEVKGYSAGGDYQADDAPIQRRNAKVKAMKLRMADQEKMDDAKAKRRYEAEQEMIQSRANLLPSPVRMQKGGEVKGYALGGRSAQAKAMAQKMAKPNAPQKSPMVQPQPTVFPEMPPQRFVNSGMPQGKMGALSSLMRQPNMQQQVNGLPSYAQSNNSKVANLLGLAPTQQPTGQMPSWMQSQINQLTMQPPTGDIPSWAQPYIAQFPAQQPNVAQLPAQQPIGGMQNGYAPPPNIQQLASLANGPIPNYAQPYINQPNQSPVNAPTQAGMPPQMAGAGIGNIGVGTGTGTGTTSAFKRGGSVSKGKTMESSAKDKAQDKAMIKKAMKQHDQQEHKGGKGTVLKLKQGGKPPVKGVKLVGMKREPQAVIKKEIALLKKANAPTKMIKHEEIEAMPAMACGGGMRKGGSAMKKGVPTFNRTPKC